MPIIFTFSKLNIMSEFYTGELNFTRYFFFPSNTTDNFPLPFFISKPSYVLYLFFHSYTVKLIFPFFFITRPALGSSIFPRCVSGCGTHEVIVTGSEKYNRIGGMVATL